MLDVRVGGDGLAGEDGVGAAGDGAGVVGQAGAGGGSYGSRHSSLLGQQEYPCLLPPVPH